MDTVVYKVHNIKSYPVFFAAIELLRNKGKGKVRMKTDDPFEAVNTWRRAYVNIALDLFFIEPYMIKKHVKSSSNFINISHDTQQDLVKIEFSLPKFLYGNNVVELLPSLSSNRRTIGRYDMLSQAHFWLRSIKKVIENLFYDITYGAEGVRLTDVEISRVDICLNQIYPTKEDALFSLESMKRVRIKKAGETMFHPYDYAVTFNNPRYYFKVYHKGKEFEKNGVSDVAKAIKAFGKEKIRIPDFLTLTGKHIPDLQKYADRCLRYELECKKGLLNYLFNFRLKKMFMPEYRELSKLLYFLFDPENVLAFKNYVVYYKDEFGNVSGKKKGHYIFPFFFFSNHITLITDQVLINKLIAIDEAACYIKDKFLLNRDKNWKRSFQVMYDFFVKENNKSHSFFLQIDGPDACLCHQDKNVVKGNTVLDQIGLLESTAQKQRFSVRLLVQCIKVHNGFFKSFQFENLPTQDNIAMMVRKVNETNVIKTEMGTKLPKIRQSSTILMFRLIAEYGSLDMVKKAGIVSRNTITNWRKKCAKFGNPNGNVHYENFTTNYVRTYENAYVKHYNLMSNSEIPLNIFLQKHPVSM